MFSSILPRSKKQRKTREARDKLSPPGSPASFYSASANLPSVNNAPPVPSLPQTVPSASTSSFAHTPRFAWSSSKTTSPPPALPNLVIPASTNVSSAISRSFSPEIQLELGFTSESLLEDFTDLFDKRRSGTLGRRASRTLSIQATQTRDPAIPTTPTRPTRPVPAAPARSRTDLSHSLTPIKIPDPATSSSSRTLPVLMTQKSPPDNTSPSVRAKNGTNVNRPSSPFRAPSPTSPHPPSASVSASSVSSVDSIYSYSSAFSYASAPDLDWGLSPGGPYTLAGPGNHARLRRGSTGSVSDMLTLAAGNGRLRQRNSHRLTRQDSATLPVDPLFGALASPSGGGRRSRRSSESRHHSRHVSRHSRRRMTQQQGLSRPGSLSVIVGGSRPGSMMSSSVSMSRPGSVATSALLTPAEPPMPHGAAEVARANAAELTRQQAGEAEAPRGTALEVARQRVPMVQGSWQASAPNALPDGGQLGGSASPLTRRKRSAKHRSRGAVERDRSKDTPRGNWDTSLYVPSPSSSSQDANFRVAGSPASALSSIFPKISQLTPSEPGPESPSMVVSNGHVKAGEIQERDGERERGAEGDHRNQGKEEDVQNDNLTLMFGDLWEGSGGGVAEAYLARAASVTASETVVAATTTMTTSESQPGERPAPVATPQHPSPLLQSRGVSGMSQGHSPVAQAGTPSPSGGRRRALPPSPQSGNTQAPALVVGGSIASRELPQPGYPVRERAATSSPRPSPQAPPPPPIRSPARFGGAAVPPMSHYALSSSPPHLSPKQHPPPAYPPPSHPPPQQQQPQVPYPSYPPRSPHSPSHLRSQTTPNDVFPLAEPGSQGRSVSAPTAGKPEVTIRTPAFSPEASSLSLGSNSGSGLWEHEPDSANSVPTSHGSPGALLGTIGMRSGSPANSGKFMHPPRPSYSPFLADARKNKSTGDVSQSQTTPATPVTSTSSESAGSSTVTTVAAGGMARARRVSAAPESRGMMSYNPRVMLPIGPKPLTPPNIDRLQQQRQRSESEPHRRKNSRTQNVSDPTLAADQVSVPTLYHRKTITDSLPQTPHDFSPVLTPASPPPPSQPVPTATSAGAPVMLIPSNRTMPKPPVIEPAPSHKRRSRPPLPIGPRKPSMRVVAPPAQASGQNTSTTASSPPLPTAPLATTSATTSTAAAPAAVSTSAPTTTVTRTGSHKALHTPPSPKFYTRPVPWRGLTMDAAKWTLTSSQLQDIVGRAIRQSAEASSIRLLTLDVLDKQIPDEIRRLEASREEIKAKYRVIVRRRRGLFRSIMLYAEGSDSETRARLSQDLLDVSVTCDQLAEELFHVMDQLQQLTKLKDVHSASALAMALRKLNSSFLKQSSDLAERAKQMSQLEAERDEAWAMAERIEQDLIDLQAKMMVMENGMSTPNSAVPSNRSSRVSAARKTSIRASKASLRISRGAHSSHSSMSSQRLSVFGLAPPVPPIPSLPPYSQNLSVNTDLASASALSPHSIGMSPSHFNSPTPESRALAEVQNELYDMLGISRAELWRTRSSRSHRPASEVVSPSSLPGSPFPPISGGGGGGGVGGRGSGGSGRGDAAYPQLGSRRRNASFSGQPRAADSMYSDILAEV